MKKGLKIAAAVGGAALAGVTLALAAEKWVVDRAVLRLDKDLSFNFLTLVSGEINHDSPERRATKEMIHEGAEFMHSHITDEYTIKGYDGIDLFGHWLPAENPRRVLIAFHGWHSKYDYDFSCISRFWYNSGCSVLYVDQRGTGKSGGKAITFGLKERFDAVKWAEFVCSQLAGDLSVYLCGVSLGATTVLMAAGEKLPSGVKGITADSGFISPQEIFRHVSSTNLHIPYRFAQKPAEKEFQKKTGAEIDSFSTLDALKKASVPILLIHGSGDKFVPYESSIQNYIVCQSPKKLLIVPNAGHVMSYVADKEHYESIQQLFWDEHK